MGRISEMLRKAEDLGYTGDNLTARVCQDIVLNDISRSTLNRNVTIKGGVVMREITGDVRRATQDMYYLKDHINASKLEQCISEFILIDQGMKENNMSDSKQQVCPEEKVKAIENAMRHFQMI